MTEKSDIFLNRTVTKTAIPKGSSDDDSRGRSSSSSRSGGIAEEF